MPLARPTNDRRRTRQWLPATAGVLVLTTALLGCGDDGTDASPTTGPPSSRLPTSGAPAEPTCADGTVADRRYLLCTAGDAAHQPLIVALHGRGSSNVEMQAATGLENSAAAVFLPDQ